MNTTYNFSLFVQNPDAYVLTTNNYVTDNSEVKTQVCAQYKCNLITQMSMSIFKDSYKMENIISALESRGLTNQEKNALKSRFFRNRCSLSKNHPELAVKLKNLCFVATPNSESPFNTDILTNIFSYLNLIDFTKSSLVCHDWNKLSKHNWLLKQIVEKEVGKHIISDFSYLVKNESLNWKEVFKYRSLSNLTTEFMEYKMSTDKMMKAENPLFENIDYPSVYLPQFYTRHGEIHFNISNSIDVKLTKSNDKEFVILNGENKKYITHLAVDKNFLYALRTDGKIVQWDYEKLKINQIFETAYSKKNITINQLGESSIISYNGIHNPICGHHAFYVKDDYIIMKYGNGLCKTLEIIPISHPDSVHTLINNNELPLPQQIIIDRNQLYILGRTHIFVWDLLQKKQLKTINIKMSQYGFTWHIDLKKDNIIASCSDNTFHVIDRVSGEEYKKIKMNLSFQFFSTYKNICVGSENGEFTTIDLNSGKKIDQIHISDDISSIKKVIFESAVKTCKYTSNQLTLPQLTLARNSSSVLDNCKVM